MEQLKKDKMKIIAFGYKKGVGKNQSAKFLSTHLRSNYPGLKVSEISFASKLKDIAYQLWAWAGLKRAIYYETHRDEKEIILPRLQKSPRDLWIETGNALRTVVSSVWIDYALNGIKSDIIIITDMGFRNEAIAIRNKGGVLVKITRDGLPQGNDPREIELDSWPYYWDYEIYNNGTLVDLYKKIVCLWENCYGQ